jgi:hypothetical protein
MKALVYYKNGGHEVFHWTELLGRRDAEPAKKLS